MQVDDLKLAENINTLIKDKVVCSHDIIQRQQVPFLTLWDRPKKVIEFGKKRIDDYVAHIEFVKKIRRLLLSEAEPLITESKISSVALASTHFGVGECQELATFAFFELLKRDRLDATFIAIQGPPHVYSQHPHPYVHCFVLFGDKNAIRKLVLGPIDQLNHLPQAVVALDPYLNHVGYASTYLHECQSYLQTFAFNEISLINRADLNHRQNITVIEKNIQQLLSRPTIQALKPYQRPILEYNFDLAALEPCHETLLISLLNDCSGLYFSWGHKDYKVHAYTELLTLSHHEQAQHIHSILQTGAFYKKNSKVIFALHEINNNEEGLSQRIYDVYKDMKSVTPH